MKVCHLAQLVLPTVYNSPIYTSILHEQCVKIKQPFENGAYVEILKKDHLKNKEIIQCNSKYHEPKNETIKSGSPSPYRRYQYVYYLYQIQ